MQKLFIFILSALLVTTVHAQVADSSQRQVKLQGAINFRDMGGYAVADGRHVRWDRIFRSADISKLTDSDLTVLKDKHIASVVDLRGVQESQKAPDRLNPGMDYILCPAGSDNALGDWMKAMAAVKTEQQGDSMMRAFYIKTEFLADRYKPFFDRLLTLSDDKALVFHCTAGKDRTGIGAALLLYTLGVPYETILNDYTATNYYRSAENEKMVHSMIQGMHISEPVAREMLGAKREYLEANFNAIKQQYGSIDNFLRGPVGLDDAKIKQLKSKFLE
ncbi:MAG TPA: tyrosine-protein phosphatase [Puia sp.]|nr:tyrosine-protein phosphatase [Puia sp.]